MRGAATSFGFGLGLVLCGCATQPEPAPAAPPPAPVPQEPQPAATSARVVRPAPAPRTDDGTQVQRPEVQRPKAASSEASEFLKGESGKRVTAVIRRRMAGMEACYQRALTRDPDLGGKLTFTVTIEPSGEVSMVVVEADTVGSVEVRSCALDKIYGWRFEVEGLREKADVTFSVAFTG